MRRELDPDDWFVEEDQQGTRREREAARSEPERAPEEDWLTPTGTGTTSRSPLGAIDRRVAVVAVVVVVALIAGLAAGGVFSGAGPNVASPPTASATVPTTATSATTKQATSLLPAPSATLKPGDSGAQVSVLQRALASLGFSTGSIDGQYGTATKDAVSRFQTSARLTADGILGPATLRALTSALKGP